VVRWDPPANRGGVPVLLLGRLLWRLVVVEDVVTERDLLAVVLELDRLDVRERACRKRDTYRVASRSSSRARRPFVPFFEDASGPLVPIAIAAMPTGAPILAGSAETSAACSLRKCLLGNWRTRERKVRLVSGVRSLGEPPR